MSDSESCTDLCVERKLRDDSINGATYVDKATVSGVDFPSMNKSRCICNKGMKKRKNLDTSHNSCIIGDEGEITVKFIVFSGSLKAR